MQATMHPNVCDFWTDELELPRYGRLLLSRFLIKLRMRKFYQDVAKRIINQESVEN